MANSSLDKILIALRGSTSGSNISEQANIVLSIITGISEEFKLGEMITLGYHDFLGVSSSASHVFSGQYTGDEFILVLMKPTNSSGVELGLCPILNNAGGTPGVYQPTQKNSGGTYPKIQATYTNTNVTVTAYGPLGWSRVLLVRVPGLLT